MNTKVIYATIAGSIFAFLAGWLVFGILLMDYYSGFMADGYTALMKDPPELWAIYLSNLVSSFMIAFIFSKWANIKTFGAGFMAAMILGLLIALSVDLMFYATTNLYNSRRFYVIDIIVNGVFTGAMGGVIGFVLGLGKKDE